MGRKSDPPVVLIKWYDFTKCACVDCSRPTRAKCESTSSGVEPLTGGRGIGIVGSSDRGIRGGNWNNNSNNLSSSTRNNNNPANENNNIGFRVASPCYGTVPAQQPVWARIEEVACCGFLDRAFTGTTRFSSAPAILLVGESCDVWLWRVALAKDAATSIQGGSALVQRAVARLF